MRANITVIQALRGIAAFWVVLFHASEGGHIRSLKAALPDWAATGLFDAGHNGVAIFFALSGFVIAHSLTGATVTPAYYGRFLLRRSVRLDPAYWASMLIVVAFAFLSARVKQEAFSAPTIPQIIAHLFYLQDILRFPEINSVYWTLCYEIQFYAFFALMLMVGGRWRNGAMFTLALLSAVGLFDHLHSGLFLNLWGAFYVGVLARQTVEQPRWIAGLMLLTALLSFQSAFGAISGATAIFLWLAVYSGWGEHGMNWRWIQFLGGISYSLYLIHNPVSGAMGFVSHRLLGDGIMADLAALGAICGASLAGATLLWFAVERPSHRLSRRISLSRRPEARDPAMQTGA